MRNLSSVGIQLRAHLKSGLLRMYSARTEGISAEEHLIRLRSLLREHRPRCMVIDPLTAIAKAGAVAAARSVANRFIYMVKDEGISLMVTALSESDDPRTESTDLQISTIADTWIHLSYLVRERRAQPRADHHQVARDSAFQPGARAGPDRFRPEAHRRLQRRGRGADGHAALGKGSRGGRHEEPGTARSSSRSGASCSPPKAKTSAQIKALQMDLQRQRAELVSYSHEKRRAQRLLE